MKKVMLLILVIGGVVGFFLYQSNMAPEQKQEIRTGRVTRGDIILKIDCNGRVVSNFDVEIKSKASGEVIAFPFDISDKVKQSDLILRLDPIDEQRNVQEAEADLNIAVAQLKQMGEKIKIARHQLNLLQKNTQAQITIDTQKLEDAKRKARDAKRLYGTKVISEDEYEDTLSKEIQTRATLEITTAKNEEIKAKELEIKTLEYEEEIMKQKIIQKQVKLDTARQRLKDTEIVAPMDGVVTEKFIQKGQIISSGISNVGGGTKILTLSDLSKIFVIASVDESDIGKVQLNQDVLISVDAYPDITFLGKVVQIGAKGVNINNVVTFEVKIEVVGRQKFSLKREKKDDQETSKKDGKEEKDSKETSKKSDKDDKESRKDKKDDKENKESRKDKRMMLGDYKSLLKPEMTANISIIQDTRKDVFMVPSDTLMYDYKTRKYRVEILKNGIREMKEVEVGLNNGMVAEVKGLEENTEVVIQTQDRRSRMGPPGMFRRISSPR